jgi:hypothetical protein
MEADAVHGGDWRWMDTEEVVQLLTFGAPGVIRRVAGVGGHRASDVVVGHDSVADWSALPKAGVLRKRALASAVAMTASRAGTPLVRDHSGRASSCAV